MLYKFRGIENPQFTLDILKNNRLYCADFRDLNDPMEGTYDTLRSGPHAPHSQQIKEIFDGKVRTRVCSLTRTYKDHPMWAYYASNSSGLAIEIDLPDSVAEPINYASGHHIETWGERDDAYKIARRILVTKHSAWEHEKEVRILNDGQFFPLSQGSISRVIFGSRCSGEFRADVEAVCEKFGIQTASLRFRSGQLHAA